MKTHSLEYLVKNHKKCKNCADFLVLRSWHLSFEAVNLDINFTGSALNNILDHQNLPLVWTFYVLYMTGLFT